MYILVEILPSIKGEYVWRSYSYFPRYNVERYLESVARSAVQERNHASWCSLSLSSYLLE